MSVLVMKSMSSRVSSLNMHPLSELIISHTNTPHPKVHPILCIKLGTVEGKSEWILNTERTSNTENKARAEVPRRSLFDSLAGQWRCSCCGTYAGVVLKCSAAACTVRAHPLCVSLLGEAWGSFRIYSSPDNSPEVHAASDSKEQVPTAIGFLCALHRP
jgi:hypothetical protein